MNGSTFISQAVSVGGEAAQAANDDTTQALYWINRAIVNRHAEVCELMNKWEDTTGTVNSDGYTIDLPSDWDWIAPIELYSDSDYQNDYDDMEVKSGKIWLGAKGTAGKTYYIRYRKEPTTYSSLSTDIAETANPRLLNILLDEFLALFLAADNDLDASSQESQQLSKSDRLS